MESTYVCNYLPSSTTESIARQIDLGLLDSYSIIGKPNRREAGYVQQFIREYLESKNSDKL